MTMRSLLSLPGIHRRGVYGRGVCESGVRGRKWKQAVKEEATVAMYFISAGCFSVKVISAQKKKKH